MQGCVKNIEKEALENNNFRKVIYTAKNSQLVVMNLKAGEDIGQEVHNLDQFIRIEKGEGKAVLDGAEHQISDGFAVVIPSGTQHNIINGPDSEMKIYTIYSPPNHRLDVVHATKAEAEADKEYFDGQTNE